MSEELATPAIKDKPVNPTIVGIVMALVALVAPLAFFFSGYDGLYISLIAILWSFTSSSYYTQLVIADIFTLGMSMPFGFLRLAYAYQMFRLYNGRTTKKRTLTLGIVSELPLAILFIPYLIMWLLNPLSPLALAAPTLILLIVGILIVKFKPPPKPPETWVEISEKKSWWEEKSEEEP
jgi:hypothetical protein